MIKLITRFVKEDAGQDLVEYAFLVGLIALVVAVGVSALATAVDGYYDTVAASAPFGGGGE